MADEKMIVKTLPRNKTGYTLPKMPSFEDFYDSLTTDKDSAILVEDESEQSNT